METIVDIRTEFIGMVLKLSKYCETYPHQFNPESNKNYNNEIYENFSKFKSHPFISIVNKLIDNDEFGYGAAFAIVLQNFDESFNLIENLKQNEYTKTLSSKIGQQFKVEIKNFFELTKFNDFYILQKQFYNNCIKIQEEYFAQNYFEVFFKKFYGLKDFPKTFCNLFLGDSSYGGFGINVGKTLYPTLSVQFNENQEMYPCADTFIFHEMSHPIINPLTDKYFFKLEKTHFNKKVQHYENFKSLINDYIIRSAEIIYLKNINSSEKIISRRLNMEASRGFDKISDVVKCLENYNQNRTLFKDIESFYPTLLENLLMILNDGICNEKLK